MKRLNRSRFALCMAVFVLSGCGAAQTPNVPGIAVDSVAHTTQRVSPDGIVYAPVNVHIESSNYNLDLNNDGTIDFVIAESNTGFHWTFGPCKGRFLYNGTLELTGQGSDGVEVSGNFAARLVSGSPIGPGQSFSTGSWEMETAVGGWGIVDGNSCVQKVGTNGNWPPNTSGYVGLAFMIRGKPHYGWAAITVSSPQQGWLSATLTGYAYQTIAGKSIKAGQM
jgi:hypothetical protein